MPSISCGSTYCGHGLGQAPGHEELNDEDKRGKYITKTHTY